MSLSEILELLKKFVDAVASVAGLAKTPIGRSLIRCGIGASVFWAVTILLLIAYYHPVLIDINNPWIITRYPVADRPPKSQDEGIAQVLWQRRIIYVESWGLRQNNNATCDEACDTTEIYDSWTVLVPIEKPVALKGEGRVEGVASYDKIIEAITPHDLRQSGNDPQHPQWSIDIPVNENNSYDVVIVRSKVFGAFQPLEIERQQANPNMPIVIPCQQDAGSITILHPTTRADLIIKFPQNMPIERTRVDFMLSENDKEPQAIDSPQNGINIQEHAIHWTIPSSMLQDTGKKKLVFWVKWRWRDVIKDYTICRTR